MIEKKVNLLFVGKNGGCFVINKVIEYNSNLHAYYNLMDYIEREKEDFYLRSEPYNPKRLKLNPEIKSIFDSIGVKYTEGCEVVYRVAYKYFDRTALCNVQFIENNGKLYFKMMLKGDSFVLTPERFINSFTRMYDDMEDISQEEFESGLKEILATGFIGD